MDILVTVEGQKMKLASNQTHHIEGSSQFVKFVFDLSDEWVGLDTNVQFIQNGEAYGQKLDGSGNKKYAFLPNGITEGECKMVLYGGDGTIRATTNYIPLSIGKDISALRTLSENISRTNYEQALNELKQYVANGGVTEVALNQAFSKAVNEIATEENVKQEIASGITTAKTEIENAKVSIENAKTEISNSVATVKESEEKTKEYANGVQEIINSAETIKNEANEALVNANAALSNANTALATAEDAIKARDEIIGKTGSVKSPEPNSALEEIRQARKDILGDDGGGGIVEQVTTLKTQAEAAKAAAIQSAGAAATSEKNVKAIESKIDQANTSAAQIESFRTEMTTAHTAVINARNDILAKGDDKKSVYDKIIDAKTSINSSKDLIIGSDGLIIGSDGTVTAPGKGSALDKVQKAQAAAEAAQEAAEQARIAAEGFAASANKGITVINDLKYDDTENALSAALSAYQGRVLNESKLNLSGGTMTGTLKLNGDPSNSNDAATKNYVDTHMPSLVTTNNDGVMSKEDKVKLDGLENALAAKVNKEDGKGLSTNDFTTNEKTKLAGLENYTLPTASDTVKGGIKVGAGLTMNGEVLSATGGGTADAVDWSNVTNKPETFAPSTHTHTASEVTELATVATSGSYNDLSDKPTDFAPAAHTHEMTDIIGLSDALDGKSDTTHNHDGTYLKSVPIATETTLGVIKVGTGLSVTNDGTLSADAQAIKVTPLITENSTEAVSSGAVYTQLSGLKFVVSKTAPTSADDNTFTIVVPN